MEENKERGIRILGDPADMLRLKRATQLLDIIEVHQGINFAEPLPFRIQEFEHLTYSPLIPVKGYHKPTPFYQPVGIPNFNKMQQTCLKKKLKRRKK